MTTPVAAVALTPGGHDLTHWAERRAAADRLDLADLARLLGIEDQAELIVFAAHPDDETLGLGRLIHRWGRQRGAVTAVVATAGEACVDHVAPRVAGLEARRLAEWSAAMAVLGADDHARLGLPDGQLADHEEIMTERIAAVLAPRLHTGDRPVLAAPWRGDPHPDHRAVGRVAGTLGRRLGLPVIEFGVWMTYWADPCDLDDDHRRLAVMISDEDDERAFTLACEEFPSQLRPLAPGWEPVVPEAMLAHLSEQLLVLPEDGR